VGSHVSHKHLCALLPIKGSHPIHEAGKFYHQHDFDPIRQPSAHLLAYASTKGAVSNFTAGLAEMVAEKGIRVNAVAPGPIWTPLIPSTMPPEKTTNFGEQTLIGRAGQHAELAGAYVLLASDLGSYMTGAVVPVTGGEIMI
jgi:NAD(P)-dependent dehydrogenase (short-subunit alcohol dehydrogenase family)